MTVEERRLQLMRMSLTSEGQDEFRTLLRMCPGWENVTDHSWTADMLEAVEAVLRREFGGVYTPTAG